MIKKNIFGKCYQFTSIREYKNLLEESVALYSNADDLNPDVEIHIDHTIRTDSPLSINPKIHKKLKNGMVTYFSQAVVFWSWDDSGCLKAEVRPIESTGLNRAINKFRSIEFPKRIETFEQILHELVLVTSVYFFSDIAPIHAASVKVKGKAFLFSGTGGAGKSSLLLALRRIEKITYLSDDITIVSDRGVAFGNMAWPKIYGYNCLGNNLKNEILANRGLIDSIHFNVRNRINPERVRRKIAPNKLYLYAESSGVTIDALYFLFRENVKKIKVSCLSIDDAIKMTISVMMAEYSVFHNFIRWEEFNSVATGTKPMLTINGVICVWRSIFIEAFSKINIFKVSLPFHIDNKEYQEKILKIINL